MKQEDWSFDVQFIKKNSRQVRGREIEKEGEDEQELDIIETKDIIMYRIYVGICCRLKETML